MNSSLYRELSNEELKRLIRESIHTEISSAKLLTGGLFNTTYYIKTVDMGDVVLRVGPVNRHLLLPFEHNLMEAEECVYKLCRTEEIPVSEVLVTDTSKTLIDRDFMIVRYIPSLPMIETELNISDNARICRDIGMAAAKMHSIKNSRFGRITDVKNGNGFSKWSECLLNEFEQWESAAASTMIFSKAERTRIRQAIENAVPILDEIQTPSLVHTDLWKGNILIRSDSEEPEFAAIIDADRAIWGDPDLEFSSIQWTYTEPTFWEGYGQTLSMDSSSRTRRTVYTLLLCLFNAYVYMQEYNQHEKAHEEKMRVLNQLDILGS